MTHTFTQVTNQLKMVSAAFFSVCMLQTQLHVSQWASLILLGVGVVLTQTTRDPPVEGSAFESDTSDFAYWQALAAAVTATVISGYAGVFVERMLKGGDVSNGAPSLLVLNVQLSLYSALVALLQVVVFQHHNISDGTILQGFGMYAAILIALQAVGGLLTAFVLKYTDNIVKVCSLG
jgi:UDP-sugar transporter A1/2/3